MIFCRKNKNRQFNNNNYNLLKTKLNHNHLKMPNKLLKMMTKKIKKLVTNYYYPIWVISGLSNKDNQHSNLKKMNRLNILIKEGNLK